MSLSLSLSSLIGHILPQPLLDLTEVYVHDKVSALIREELSTNKMLSSSCLQLLKQQSEGITTLDLSGVDLQEAFPYSLAAILQALPELTSIKVQNCNLQDEHVQEICEFTKHQLQRLDLSKNIGISNIALFHIAANCPNIAHLDFRETVPHHGDLDCMVCLMSVDAAPYNKYEYGFTYLFNLPELKELNLEGNSVIELLERQISDLERQLDQLTITRD
jgi:hypothetical protein